MANTKLNPPIIESKLNAFAGTRLVIPFTLSKAVGAADFDGVQLLIKTVSTGREIGTVVADAYSTVAHGYQVEFSIDTSKLSLTVGQYYKIQLALRDGDNVGYYSSVGTIKYTAQPSVIIEELEDNDNKQHVYQYTGKYTQEEDTSEKAYSYCFNLYNETSELVATSGTLLHDSTTDEDKSWSIDTWVVRKNLDPNISYTIEYLVTTVNGLSVNKTYQIIESETTAPNVHAKLSATNCYEDGYINLRLVGNGDNALVNGCFILLRASSEDGYQSWCELTRFALTRWSSNETKDIVKDRTVKQGISYRYAIRAYNAKGLFSNRLLACEGDVLADFEDAFLFDGERQLKIRFNPKVSSFKTNRLETKTDTIGGKYPFVFRNGNVDYREFPISGLISLLGDENDQFLSGLGPVDYNLSSQNIAKEREFKMLVLEWLTDGKPKLFRSPTEGNFIVRLMNTSLSPNDTLGRMLHTFSTTAYEVAECNYDNLKAYGFAEEDYTETRDLKFVSISCSDLQTSYSLKNAVYVAVSMPYGTKIKYTLDGVSESKELTIGVTSNYLFDSDILLDTPMTSITLVSNSWGEDATITYGYYDETAKTFSLVYDITVNDKVTQFIGQGLDINLLSDFNDIHKSTGAFHYLKVAPREQVDIYHVSGGYYYNSSYDTVGDLNANLLYIIHEGFTDENPTEYFDGAEGKNRKKIADINYQYSMTGMQSGQYIDFNGRYISQDGTKTTGRYEALTNISSLDNLSAGNGLLLDVVYQEKVLTYIVEVDEADNQYKSDTVISNKSAYEAAYKKYLQAVENKETNNISSLKNKAETAYNKYVKSLQNALDNLIDEYEVDYAI